MNRTFPSQVCRVTRAMKTLERTCSRSLRTTGVALVVLGWAGMARAEPDTVIRYRCLPHIEPPWHRPNKNGTLPLGREKLDEQDIRDYLAAPVLDAKGIPDPENLTRRDCLENADGELLLIENREFARLVLGQTQVFVDIAEFRHSHPHMRVKVKFIQPRAWFTDVSAEADSNTLSPAEAAVYQIGDSWEQYFMARQLIVGKAERYFWDLRVLAYNRDQLRSVLGPGNDIPSNFNTREKFQATALKLKSAGLMPLALSTSPDPDMIWSLSPWLWNAGADLVTDKGRPFWWPKEWWQSGLDTPAANDVISWFMDLRKNDCLESRELSANELADGVLRGDFTFTLIEPFIPWRAKSLAKSMKWTDGWQNHIGAALPPHEGGGKPVTFLGGSLLAVLCRETEREKHTAVIAAERQWIQYLLQDDVVERHMKTQQFIPNSDKVWEKYDDGHFKKFFDDALAGTGYTSAPSDLQHMQDDFRKGPHGAYLRMADWPKSVEGPATVSQLYQFWYRLRILPPGSHTEAQQALVMEAALEATMSMNEQMPKGQAWIWILVSRSVFLAMICSGVLVYTWRRSVERQHERQWREIVAKDRERAQQFEQRARRAEQELIADRPDLAFLFRES